MKVVVRGRTGPLRSSLAFTLSTVIHGSILVWVVFGPPASSRARPRSLYDLAIRPNEKRIVWYNLRDRLPDIAPAAQGNRKAPRARVRFDQTIVAGAKDDARAPQMIRLPAPELDMPKPLPLPNVVAVAPPRRVARLFAPPPVEKPSPAPALPEAPAATAVRNAPKLPFEAPNPRPQPRAFTPPPAVRAAVAVPAPLPAAPEFAVAAPSVVLPKVPRPFLTPRPRPAPHAAILTVSDAPDVSPSAMEPAETSLAIVGLNPVKIPEVSVPPGSHPAGFSGGPKITPPPADGAADPSAPEGALLVVPGLLAHGGAKENRPVLAAASGPTSRENLMAAARMAAHGTPPPAPSPLTATRVTSSPDPRMAGRVVYTVAIQMPNVTSYSGSWIVWFAEHEPVPGAPPAVLHAPVPLRKVDPKYIAAAVSERVEGKVLLSAVIGKDGHVGSVALLRHLDDRLDRTAEEALAKWEFEPALRNGAAVDVDAVFEIPFRLAPRTTR